MYDPDILEFKATPQADLKMYVFRPDSPTFEPPLPAVAFFFCGGWRGFDRTKFYPHSVYLASRGLVCANAEVRVSRHGTTPAECVADAKSAVRFLRANAQAMGLDPSRVAVCGGSAGGHVAAATGIIEGFDEAEEDRSVSSVPDAMVLFNPALDTASAEKRIKIFGGVERARSLSPLQHVKSGNPPALVMHGHDDQVVEVSQAIRFHRAMQDAGNRCELRLYEGAGHGFFNYFDGRNPFFTRTLKEMDIFLQSLGYCSGPDRVDGYSFERPADR